MLDSSRHNLKITVMKFFLVFAIIAILIAAIIAVLVPYEPRNPLSVRNYIIILIFSTF